MAGRRCCSNGLGRPRRYDAAARSHCGRLHAGRPTSRTRWSARACARCSSSASRRGRRPADVDAVVVALKSRTIPGSGGGRAVARRTRRGCDRRRRATVLCSNTARPSIRPTQGNIGPVADALLEALGADFTVFCPAFPENGRTIYRGYLFVGDVLLSEVRHARPSADADARRQSRAACCAPDDRQVGLVPLAVGEPGCRGGPRRFRALRARGLPPCHPRRGQRCRSSHDRRGARPTFELDHRRLRHRDGTAGEFPPCRAAAADAARGRRHRVRGRGGRSISGSCSTATLAQVAAMRRSASGLRGRSAGARRGAAGASRRRSIGPRRQLGERPAAVSASAAPERVRAVQERLGRERAGASSKRLLAEIARGARRARRSPPGRRGRRDLRRDRAGARHQRAAHRAGRSIPACPGRASLGEPTLALALKSGNFGREDFFLRAFTCLD